MKHCHNPDCPHLQRTGNPAEYRDEIEACADCGMPLHQGATERSARSPVDADGEELITVATFPNAHEAHMARAFLESEQIPAIVGQDHGQFVTAAGWVTLAVPRCQAELAEKVLEQRPAVEPTDIEGEPEDDEEPLEEVARGRAIGRAARWVAFLAILFALVGTFWGFVDLSLVNNVRAELEPFEETAVVPEAILHTVYDAYGFDLFRENPQTAKDVRGSLDAIVIWGFAYHYIIAAVYGGLYFWARRSPVPALIVALCVYVMLQVLVAVDDPATLYQGLLWKLLIVGALVAGIRAALREVGERDPSEPSPVQGD